MGRLLRVLVACEESQAVTKEFRMLGHEAFSCDILPCSGGHPEWHIQGDVLKQLNDTWDLVIGFPPCTFISNAGACRLYPTKGVLDNDRYLKGLEGKKFFMSILQANCSHIAVENPVSSKIFEMPAHSQEFQPYHFGHPYTKKTRLWLRGLPILSYTNVVAPIGPYLPAGTSRKDKTKYGVAAGSVKRSKTFEGVAKAMATQWSEYVTTQQWLNS